MKKLMFLMAETLASNFSYVSDSSGAGIIKRLKQQSGRSMIEMLGVLAIIGVLSVAGISGYSKAMMNYKVNKLIEDNKAIAANLMMLSANERDYSFLGYEDEDIGNHVAISLGVIPENMIDSDGNIINAFGGEVKICATDYNGVEYGVFNIINYNLPKEAVLALSMNVTATSDNNIRYIKIN